MFEKTENFGITVVLPQCAFSAELARESIQKMLMDIDDRLTEQGAPENSHARSGMMMENALNVSKLVANDEIDATDGVSDIAWSFIYAFAVTVGFDQVHVVRGLTGSYLRDRLSMVPCLGETEFQTESALLQRYTRDYDDSEEWDDDADQMPTLH
jgi:hypothetical protein